MVMTLLSLPRRAVSLSESALGRGQLPEGIPHLRIVVSAADRHELRHSDETAGVPMASVVARDPWLSPLRGKQHGSPAVLPEAEREKPPPAQEALGQEPVFISSAWRERQASGRGNPHR
ncbi:unnamed protein product [Rangifer tarandus platyrhynchus]|uniref:Uncharacterized protein n=1 Tax=Rangifer tarandus platyrhynchus TaxID=3082113 RepID=A0AC60A980_RANTA